MFVGLCGISRQAHIRRMLRDDEVWLRCGLGGLNGGEKGMD